MRSNDKKYLKKALDQIEVQRPPAHFEQRIYQDWQRTVSNANQSTQRFFSVLVLARLHPKVVGLLAIMAIAASVLIGQHWMSFEDEELHQIDVLSELSLSTI